MKILFCVEFYFPSLGGAQEVVRQLAERMVEFGHKVSVATSKISSRTSMVHNGVAIQEFDVSGNYVKGLRGDVDRYREFLVKSEFDLVFFYAAQQWTFDAALHVINAIPGKTVLVPCGYSGLYQPLYCAYFRDLHNTLRQLDGVIYHSKKYRDYQYAIDHGIANGILITNGADEKEFMVPKDLKFRREFGIDDDSIVLLTVGTLTGLKGHLELSKAFSEVSFNGRKVVLLLNGNVQPTSSNIRKLRQWPLYFNEYGFYEFLKRVLKYLLLVCSVKVGKTQPLIESIESINKQLTQGKRILLLDLPRPKLIQAYLNSDLFVFASNIEYSPLVLFEACAAGLPFLSVPVGNSEEIVSWTSGGEICPSDVDALGYTRVDTKILASRIEMLISDHEKLFELGNNGRHAWLLRYNWQNIAKEYESYFLKLINTELS